jgi:hypothetical protein
MPKQPNQDSHQCCEDEPTRKHRMPIDPPKTPIRICTAFSSSSPECPPMPNKVPNDPACPGAKYATQDGVCRPCEDGPAGTPNIPIDPPRTPFDAHQCLQGPCVPKGHVRHPARSPSPLRRWTCQNAQGLERPCTPKGPARPSTHPGRPSPPWIHLPDTRPATLPQRLSSTLDGSSTRAPCTPMDPPKTPNQVLHRWTCPNVPSTQPKGST